MAMVVPSLASPAGATVGGTGLGFDGVSQNAKWGVATATGSGGLPTVIPLITEGRSQSESAAADLNYFLGINAMTGAWMADFEEAQTAAGGVTPGTNHPVSGTTAIPADDVWHHAAGTYDGSSWSLYLDGLKEAGLFVGVPANAETTAVAAVGSALPTTGNLAGLHPPHRRRRLHHRNQGTERPQRRERSTQAEGRPLVGQPDQHPRTRPTR